MGSKYFVKLCSFKLNLWAKTNGFVFILAYNVGLEVFSETLLTSTC